MCRKTGGLKVGGWAREGEGGLSRWGCWAGQYVGSCLEGIYVVRRKASLWFRKRQPLAVTWLLRSAFLSWAGHLCVGQTSEMLCSIPEGWETWELGSQDANLKFAKSHSPAHDPQVRNPSHPAGSVWVWGTLWVIITWRPQSRESQWETNQRKWELEYGSCLQMKVVIGACVTLIEGSLGVRKAKGTYFITALGPVGWQTSC